MAYTPEQRKVIRRIITIGQRRGVGPKQLAAALETGRVESNFQNLPGGDRDSVGWRQERASLYRNPHNLNASINRFFNETSSVAHRYKRAGDLAAAVQRPAAQYRGRYQQHSSEADRILRSFTAGRRTTGRGGVGGTPSRRIPGIAGVPGTLPITTVGATQQPFDLQTGGMDAAAFVSGLLSAAKQQKPVIQSAGIPDPSFWSRSALKLPQGYQPAQSGGGATPRTNITDLLSAVSGLGATDLPGAGGGGQIPVNTIAGTAGRAGTPGITIPG